MATRSKLGAKPYSLGIKAQNSKRPPLTPKISLGDFHGFYWYLNELTAFCRQYGLPSTGQKHELVKSVEHYLGTGKRASGPKPAKNPLRRIGRVSPEGPITLETPVTEAYKCDDRTRAFFKSILGEHFHFTAHQQQFRREKMRRGEALTYGDLAREWTAERERRKDPHYKSQIAGSWQYNQFVRDFAADKEKNSGKRISAAAKAWNLIRAHRGPHTYAEFVRITK